MLLIFQMSLLLPTSHPLFLQSNAIDIPPFVETTNVVNKDGFLRAKTSRLATVVRQKSQSRYIRHHKQVKVCFDYIINKQRNQFFPK
jgi:hypothetical protein